MNLHKALMDDFDAFAELADNRFRGDRYVDSQGTERHYRSHVKIALEIFPDKLFEEVAAVTELFFCASESAARLPIGQSPCASRYFERVLAFVQPAVVFAVGRQVEAYLIHRFGSKEGITFARWGEGRQAKVIALPHPNSYGKKASAFTQAAEGARAHLLSGEPPNRESTTKPIFPVESLSQLNPDTSHSGQSTAPSEKRTRRVSYRSTRLYFKRSQIEPLDMEDEIEIVTQNVTWRMTKADFYRVFKNVPDSKSYSGPRGEYFYSKPPKQAEPFRVSEAQHAKAVSMMN